MSQGMYATLIIVGLSAFVLGIKFQQQMHIIPDDGKSEVTTVSQETCEEFPLFALPHVE
jgi:hypothetical protein